MNRESWTAVRRGFLTFGTGFTSKSFSSRHLHRIMGIIKTQALHLRPVIVTAAQGFITEFYQFFVSSFSHKFRYMLQN